MINKTYIFNFFLLSIISTNFSAAASQVDNLEKVKSAIYNALLSQKVIDLDRQLVHLSYVCSITMDEKKYPVIDLQENTKSSTTPRGINRIVVLDNKLTLVKKFEYTRERPLFCSGNKLFVFGAIEIEGVPGTGNAILFDKNHIDLKNIEASDYPLPITRNLSK